MIACFSPTPSTYAPALPSTGPCEVLFVAVGNGREVAADLPAPAPARRDNGDSVSVVLPFSSGDVPVTGVTGLLLLSVAGVDPGVAEGNSLFSTELPPPHALRARDAARNRPTMRHFEPVRDIF